jgi:predicted transposase YdaD
MFGLAELKQTRYYQDVFEEGELKGKLEAIPRLVKLGLSAAQIAEALGLGVGLVEKVIC